MKHKFPKVTEKCFVCKGTGNEDISYHGSSMYVPCTYCKGDKDFRSEREMSVDEKLNYLLKRIERLSK